MTFLIVDDSRTARNLIKNYVNEIKSEHYYNFIEAENAAAALTALQTNRIDFVFLDWNLSSKMTGLDILKEIRAMEKYKTVPVFMITSEGDKVHVIEALKCGANDFIVKPIDPKVFEPKVFKLIFTLKG
jgi:two-component system chemotaxis response regulator CheY